MSSVQYILFLTFLLMLAESIPWNLPAMNLIFCPHGELFLLFFFRTFLIFLYSSIYYTLWFNYAGLNDMDIGHISRFSYSIYTTK